MPNLVQMDMEKISRLYADLRRESLSTGSFPITVRHLESTIRMAEASAKMHLRNAVRSDDIDLAIQVTIGSFVNAQKLSIKKQLERGFKKYLTKAQDHEELLAFLLGQIIKDKVRYHALRNNDQPPTEVQVKLAELQERAKDVEIYDLKHFLTCPLFRANGYRVVGDRIVKDFGQDF